MRQFKITFQFTTAHSEIVTNKIDFDLNQEDAFLYNETTLETTTKLQTNQDSLDYIDAKNNFNIFSFNIKFSDAKYTDFLTHLNNVNLYNTLILKYSDDGKTWWQRDCLISNFKRLEKAKDFRLVEFSLKPTTPFYKPKSFDLKNPEIINSHSKTFQNVIFTIKSQTKGTVIIEHIWQHWNHIEKNYLILNCEKNTTKTSSIVSNKNYLFSSNLEISKVDEITHNGKVIFFNPVYLGPGKNTFALVHKGSTTFNVLVETGDFYDFI